MGFLPATAHWGLPLMKIILAVFPYGLENWPGDPKKGSSGTLPLIADPSSPGPKQRTPHFHLLEPPAFLIMTQFPPSRDFSIFHPMMSPQKKAPEAQGAWGQTCVASCTNHGKHQRKSTPPRGHWDRGSDTSRGILGGWRSKVECAEPGKPLGRPLGMNCMVAGLWLHWLRGWVP